jgi:hypothetical protein
MDRETDGAPSGQSTKVPATGLSCSGAGGDSGFGESKPLFVVVMRNGELPRIRVTYSSENVGSVSQSITLR